jgi:pimeloyl-ACP methyl ester carboxylesterase
MLEQIGETMIIVGAILLLLLAGLIIYIYRGGPALPPETDTIIKRVINSELPEIISGQTGFAQSNDLKIWYESISPKGSPKGTVLLIMGNGADALLWPPKFVRAFVDAGYQVIRYDQRGTGMSDWLEEWDSKHPYAVADMAEDAVEILRALEIQAAHIVGFSMGGMIAQEIAIRYPDKVISLTLMMTSGFIGDPELPGLTSRYFFDSIVQGLPLLKYRIAGGEENLIKERIAKTILVIGPETLDIKELAELVLYDLRKRRGINIRGAFQHQAAITVSGSRYERLKTLDVPALVIHGTNDQFIPVEHGKKLVEIIPNAKGLWLEGVGHVIPMPNMDTVTEIIISHIGTR